MEIENILPFLSYLFYSSGQWWRQEWRQSRGGRFQWSKLLVQSDFVVILVAHYQTTSRAIAKVTHQGHMGYFLFNHYLMAKFINGATCDYTHRSHTSHRKTFLLTALKIFHLHYQCLLTIFLLHYGKYFIHPQNPQLYIPIAESIFDFPTEPQVTSRFYPTEALWHCVVAHTWITHESNVGSTSVARGNCRCIWHRLEPPSVLCITLSVWLSIVQFKIQICVRVRALHLFLHHLVWG